MKYYLINKTGKCYESKTEIPTPPYKKEDLVYEHYLQDMETWDSNLTMIDIYEDQLEVVKNKVYNFDNCAHDAPPIDITDIVEKKEIRELYNKYQNQSLGTIGFAADYIFKDYLFYKHTLSKETLDELFEAHDPEDFIDEDYVDEDFENRGKNLLEDYIYEEPNEDLKNVAYQYNSKLKKNKELLIELEDLSPTCGDGCCYTYGTNIYINGEQIEDEDGTNPHQLLKSVLTKLGYTNVRVEYK